MKNFREYLIESLNVLSLKSDAQLRELSEKLDLLSGEDKSHFWNEYSLKNTKEWEEIRELAKVCLKALSSR